MMETLLQEVADGSARGWKKWYALMHASRCYRCGNFLQRLRLSIEALRESKLSQTDSEAVDRLREKIRGLAGTKE